MGLAENLAIMPRGKAIAIGLGVAAAYYFIYFDDGSSYRAQEAQSRAAIERDNLELQKVTKLLEDAQRFAQTKAEMGEQMEKILKYIPEDFAGSALMKLISTEAKAAGVSIVKITDRSGLTKPSDFIEDMAVDLELQGSFGQLMFFMSQLTRLDKIITVKNIRMKKAGSVSRTDNLLDFSASFIGYRYVGSKGKAGG